MITLSVSFLIGIRIGIITADTAAKLYQKNIRYISDGASFLQTDDSNVLEPVYFHCYNKYGSDYLVING